jgi:hypothetical protein
MVVFPGNGRSTAIDSPRHLTIRNARRLVAAQKRQLTTKSPVAAVADDASSDDDEPPDPMLKPGEAKIYSFWAPGLLAGQKHRINVSQAVNANNNKDKELSLVSVKEFTVDAPQFALPNRSVHSTYPPSGYHDNNRILPHIVLADPHLPWERSGSPQSDGADASTRTRVPWLVLFSFTQDELMLPSTHLNGPNSIFGATSPSLIKPVKQSPTLSINMSIADLLATSKITTPVAKDSKEDAKGDFIFVKPDLFTSLFSNFDDDSKRVVPSSPNTTPYGYLAHVRHVNGSGMALAGVEDTAVFSIVIGNRTGPLDNKTPATVSVHLVSIEGVEDISLAFNNDVEYIAFCSLHSWNYTVNPPSMKNIRDSFEHLGNELDLLRVPHDRPKIKALQSGGRVKERLAARLKDGYSLVKYHVQTGEQTVALFRGPFTPTVVKDLNAIKGKCSNSGVDRQILDSDTGLMDISYSTAWQLGRTLALGDEGFTAALGRVRGAIHKPAMRESKIEAIRDIDQRAYRSRRQVLRDLPYLVSSLADIQTPELQPPSPEDESEATEPADVDPAQFEPGGPKKRWFRRRLPRKEIPDLSFSSPLVEEKYPAAALAAAERLAESTNGDRYDETNDPASTDWMIMLTWLLNRMYLDGVPAHYLITDPSHLEPESLRFFYINPNWVDALINSALSLGNHMGKDEDRVCIKKALNKYITNTPKHLKFQPQIPTYGFYLRSDLVSMFPDLRVTTLPDRPQLPPGIKDRAPLLRHEIVADGVMLGLLDRVPDSKQFQGLVLTQPPHQQRFAVAPGLDTARIEIPIRRQYTVDAATRRRDDKRHDDLEPIINTRESKNNVFIWGSAPSLNDLRILRFPRFVQAQLDTLNKYMPKAHFTENTATSALLAMQLGDPVYNLTINFREKHAKEKLQPLAPPPETLDVTAPRTLLSLEPPAIERLIPTQIEPDSSDEESEAESGGEEETVFERRESNEPRSRLLANLEPQVKQIPILEEDDAQPVIPIRPIKSTSRGAPKVAMMAMAMQINKPSTPPTFDCKVYTRGVKSGVIEINRNDEDPIEQDLVFSIQVSNNESDIYQLVEFNILIPLGPKIKHPESFYYLIEGYDGPAPTMLRNLRFNALVSLMERGKESHLQIRLLPRARSGSIGITKVNDISFLLSSVHIN